MSEDKVDLDSPDFKRYERVVEIIKWYLVKQGWYNFYVWPKDGKYLVFPMNEVRNPENNIDPNILPLGLFE